MRKIMTNQIVHYLLVKITSEIVCYFARKKKPTNHNEHVK
jgi:hypothetical protein